MAESGPVPGRIGFMVDLRRIRVLRAVAEFGSVTAAAEALHTTSSAASQQIRQLGRELGVPLLRRQGRGVVLTAGAREFLRHADAIAEQWELGYAALHRGTEPSGPLRVCGIPTAVAGLVAPATAAVRQRHPALVPEVSEAEPGEATRSVLAGTVDLAVVDVTTTTPGADDRRFHEDPLLDDPFDLLVVAGHPLAGRGRVTLVEARHEPWVVEEPSSSSHAATVGACTAAGFAPRIAHRAREWGVVAALVGHGHGVALVPRLARLPAGPAVVRVPLHGPPAPTRRISAYTRAGSRQHPAVEAVLDALHDVARRRTPEPDDDVV